MSTRCPGCRVPVVRRGLRNHILKSSDPRCRAADDAVISDSETDNNFGIDKDMSDDVPRMVYCTTSTLPPESPENPPLSSTQQTHSPPLDVLGSGPSMFDSEGDIFGDYGISLDDVFMGGSSDEDRDVDDGEGEESEEETDEGEVDVEEEEEEEILEWERMNAEAEDSLEPDRCDGGDTGPETVQAEDMRDPENDPLPLRLRGGAEEGLKLEPFVVRYQKDAQDRWTCTQPGVNFHYDQHSKNSGNQTNPYAPFQSKLEWEVARWAKLRGPSSTAFTELMAIEGVSVLFIFTNVKYSPIN